MAAWTDGYCSNCGAMMTTTGVCLFCARQTLIVTVTSHTEYVDPRDAEIERLKARAERAEAELAVWADKDGNSPGYNHQKARTYGAIAHDEREARKKAEAACAEMRAALGGDKPWPVTDVLVELADAAHILLHAKDYDGHGWELISSCEIHARQYAQSIRDALSRTDLGRDCVVVSRERLTAWRDVLTELAPTCRCDEAWTSRGRHEVNALCHMADDAKAAIADLDALLKKGGG